MTYNPLKLHFVTSEEFIFPFPDIAMQNNINKDEEVMRRSKSEITIKLLTYLKPYKLKSFLVVLLMIFVMICEIVNPLLLKIAIDDYVGSRKVNGLIVIGVSLLSVVTSHFEFIFIISW